MTGVTGKVAVISGGSRGIGKSIAQRLARDGFVVAIAARGDADLRATATAISQAGGGAASPYIVDLRDAASAVRLIDDVVRDHGRLDVLINNAGATHRGSLLDLDDDDWLDGFALKFHGTIRLTRAAWPHLARAHGQVINIVGALSHTPSDQAMIGSTICGALTNLNKALAELGRRDKVRVNAVNPGWIDTGRLARHLAEIAEREGLDSEESASARLLEDLKITRLGTPGDIAGLIGFLVSEAASFIHGASIDIDGGMTKGI
ncbi:MAG: SDR family oxidoreductase [Betaproteobacteria bacterium]|nr:SDR family oxidoreductase [Betaproteobacteria bacterium]